MNYVYTPPTTDQVKRYMEIAATRNQQGILTDEAITFGIGNQTSWSHFDSFARMIKSLEATPVGAPSLWLRKGEVFLYVHDRVPVRHCRWTRDLPGRCEKPVVQIRLCWGENTWGGPQDDNYVYNRSYWIDRWAHLDGSELHSHNDYGKLHHEVNSCEPIPMCMDCGQEFLDNHCRVCHVNGALHTTMQAYGNSTVCTTPGCTRKEDWFSIGD